MKAKKKTIKSVKRVVVEIPTELYRRFAMSKCRTESNTDGEAIRGLIKKEIGSGTDAINP